MIYHVGMKIEMLRKHGLAREGRIYTVAAVDAHDSKRPVNIRTSKGLYEWPDVQDFKVVQSADTDVESKIAAKLKEIVELRAAAAKEAAESKKHAAALAALTTKQRSALLYFQANRDAFGFQRKHAIALVGMLLDLKDLAKLLDA